MIMIFSIIFLLLQTFVNCMIMMLLYSVRLLILTGSARWQQSIVIVSTVTRFKLGFSLILHINMLLGVL